MQQLDIIRHSPAALARACRIAADTELHNPYFPPDERERRAAAHTAEAERLERIAEQDRQAASAATRC